MSKNILNEIVEIWEAIGHVRDNHTARIQKLEEAVEGLKKIATVTVVEVEDENHNKAYCSCDKDNQEPEHEHDGKWKNIQYLYEQCDCGARFFNNSWYIPETKSTGYTK